MPATLIFLFVLYLLVRLPWIFTVPMVEAPDEFAHYWVINYIREHLALPTAQAVAASGPSGVYGSMPPFGYIPHILISMLFPAEHTTLAERFGSLLSGMVAIWAAFKAGKLLFPQSRLYAIALPLLMVFHPQYVFVNAYANNDSLMSAAASVAIYLAVRSLKEGLSVTRTAWLAVALTIITVSKYSGLCVLPVVLIFMVIAGWLHNSSARNASLNMAVLALLPVVLTSGLFVRNFLEFKGDWLGTHTMYKTWADTFHIETRGQVSLWRTIKDGLWWRQVFDSFWGVFGYQNRYLPTKVYDTYLVLVLAGIGGCILQAFNKCRELVGFDTKDKSRYVEPAIWTMMFIVFAANVFAMIYAASVNLGGPQGRYLFATELPVMALLLAGMQAYGKAGRVMVIGFIAFSTVVSVFSWYMLWQLFGFQAKPY